MNKQPDNNKEFSTSALAKELNKDTQEIFQALTDFGFITRENNVWELTEKGKSIGGTFREHEKYGRYIVWPPSIKSVFEEKNPIHVPGLMTSTNIGKSFDISATKTNSILSELGFIEKGLKGWIVTGLGKKFGGTQSFEKISGVPYVRWPENIIQNKILTAGIKETKGELAPHIQQTNTNTNNDTVEFRDKFKPTLRATDGHYVRSKAEMLVDNWLYMAGLVHAYERKLPVEEEVYSDFYIPNGKVYIEYWGFDEDPKYISRKKEKQQIYQREKFRLIELTEKEVQNLDDYLPRFLLGFGVKTD